MLIAGPVRRVLFTLGAIALIAAGCGSTLAGSADDDRSDDVISAADDSEPVTTTPLDDAPPLDPAASPRATAVPERDALVPAAELVVEQGAEGSTVEDVQDSLNDFIGYADLDLDRIAEDGVFGPNTQAAQRAFEEFAGQPVDGQSSPADRSALEAAVVSLELDAADSVVSAGDESPFVGTWQTRLNVWNELVSEAPISIVVDDRFGSDTEFATLTVERALGLQADGIVEPEDRAALRAAITQAREETDVTTVLRSDQGNGPIVVKSLYTNDQYCVRFVVGFVADERCTPGVGGDVNTAYFVTVNGVSFIGGTANPNVSFVTLTSADDATTPLATRQMGNSPARAWAAIVDAEPTSIELLNGAGDSLLELRFSLDPTDRADVGPTLSLISSQYAQSFFVDDCAVIDDDSLSLAASLVGATMAVDTTDGEGTLRIAAGTVAAPISIAGSIDATSVDADTFVFTGTFDAGLFEGDSFSASGSC